MGLDRHEEWIDWQRVAGGPTRGAAPPAGGGMDGSEDAAAGLDGREDTVVVTVCAGPAARLVRTMNTHTCRVD